MPTTINLTVTKSMQSSANPGLSGNLLRIEVTSAVDIDPKIFVFQDDVDSEFSPEVFSLFWGVASVAQLSEFPADTPNADEPFFRLDSVELMYESPSELEEAHTKIMNEIIRLQNANDVVIDPENAAATDYVVTGGEATVV